MIKRILHVFFIAMAALISATPVLAFGESSDDRVWRLIEESELTGISAERFVTPTEYRTFQVNKRSLRTILNKAPQESLMIGKNSGTILTLPLPNGVFSRFAIKESPIMEPGLAAKYPDIKTYLGQGIDEPSATTRFDITPVGFRAMILTVEGTIYVEPYFKNDTSYYVSFYKTGSGSGRASDYCMLDSGKSRLLDGQPIFSSDLISNGSQLREFRLALAATGEYTNTVPGKGTVADAMAAITTTMNRVNGIYERELAIRMVLVANNDLIIYTDGAKDPYTNTNAVAMLAENQLNLDDEIGTLNYDIGHVFSTSTGGIASLGSTCDGVRKARGVTGLTDPTGERFDVDFVAHEMGHQFGANHTFNGSSGSCNPRTMFPDTAFEPGSGSTIMGYAGICGVHNLQLNSDDYFHAASLTEIISFVNSSATCSVNTPTLNTPPDVIGFENRFLPKDTPFTLTTLSADPDPEASLTHTFEEYDLGPAGPPDANVDAPIFRSYAPVAEPSRLFPSLQYILENSNSPPISYLCSPVTACLVGEVLPSISRTMNFKVTARDNQAGGGGIRTADIGVTIDENSGPFYVTSQNTPVIWNAFSTQFVFWNVANTDNPPVNEDSVRILLSTDGGSSFPTVLANSVPNDGAHPVVVPDITSTTARVKVVSSSNHFFDINDEDIMIVPSTAGTTRFDFDGDAKSDVSVFRPASGVWWYLNSSNGQSRAAQFGTSDEKIVPADYTGDGRADIAFYKPAGSWFILRSEDFTFYSFPFGTDGDIPAPGDFDGDGRDDAAVYRPDAGVWFILRSSDGGVTVQAFGILEDKPVVADYDGDGLDDIAIYRPSAQEWWILRSSAGLAAYKFGFPESKAVPGDYTGDGKADVAFWYPPDNNWYILRSEDSSFFAFPWGVSTDTAAPGDYDGDGKTDAAVWRESNTTWYVLGSSAGPQVTQFGAAGDIPVPSAYVVPEDAGPAPPAFIVTKTADTNDGACDADCSLREAIGASNAAATDDVIGFDPAVFNTPQTITLVGTELVVANNGSLTINGPGPDQLTISGNDASRVFSINPGATATLNGLKVSDGNAGGIRLLTSSTLTLNDAVVSNNSNSDGGGIFNDRGTLTINSSTISNNTAVTSGGIRQIEGVLTINDSTISGNSATNGGGGIVCNSATTIVTITDSTFNNNQITSTSGGGGGIFNGARLTVIRSTFSNNTAALGGAIYHASSDPLKLISTTISGNTSLNGGGGLAVFTGSATVVNTTITHNLSGTSGGGVISTQPFSALNSIFANNMDKSGVAHDFGGTLTSDGYNLIEDTDGTTITGAQTGDVTGVDPALGPLQNNGGPTETHALLPGSPAIEKGNSPAHNTDQRGKVRPFDDPGIPNSADGSDIGAFERQANDLRGLFDLETYDNSGLLRSGLMDERLGIQFLRFGFRG